MNLVLKERLEFTTPVPRATLSGKRDHCLFSFSLRDISNNSAGLPALVHIVSDWKWEFYRFIKNFFQVKFSQKQLELELKP
jgi:hypothetical protein